MSFRKRNILMGLAALFALAPAATVLAQDATMQVKVTRTSAPAPIGNEWMYYSIDPDNGFDAQATEGIETGPFSTVQSVAADLAANFAQDPNIIALDMRVHAGQRVNNQWINLDTIYFERRDGQQFTPQLPDTGGWFTLTTSTIVNPMTLTCSPGSLVLAQFTTCTATVEAGATGSITFSPGDSVSISPNGSSTGVTGSAADLIVPTGTAGSVVTMTATYAGDGTHGPWTASTTVNLAGNALYSYQFPNGYGPNNRIGSYIDNVNGTWSNITYDSLERLTGAVQTPNNGAAQYFCWDYDAYGNRLKQSTSNAAFTAAHCVTSGSLNQNVVSSYTPNTNRIYDTNAGVSYTTPTLDAAGNTTLDQANQYLYDGEGRICATAQIGSNQYTGYLYDAEGKRVGKGNLLSWSCDMSGSNFQQTTAYILGPNGGQMTEIAISTQQVNGAPSYTATWVHTNVFAGGELIATYATDQSGPHYQLSDWLGTRRVQTNASGAPSTFSSLPYGDSLATNGSDSTEQHFTGQERDSESGNDYFEARYYANSLGRFMSPDDGSGVYSDPGNPQSWNLYGYVQNNPLTNVDPDGHDCIHINNDTGAYEGTDSGNCDNSTEEKANSGYYVDGTVSTVKENSSGQVTGYSGTSYAGNLMTGSFASSLPSTGGFDSGSLGAAVFGSQNAGLWNSAAGTVNTIGGAEMTGILMFIDPLLAGTLPEVGLGLGGVGAAAGGTHPSTPTGRRGSPMDVPRGTNAPDVINGRQYTGHALDQMQSRGIPSSAVEDAIQNGLKSPGNTSGTTMNQGSGVSVVTNSAGDVVTVIPR